MSDLITKLNWRYATKEFDATKKISEEQLETLQEALRLTASSFGLQPWKFLFITDQETKESLVEHSWNQPQVANCSHLIVMCAPTKFDDSNIDKLIASIMDHRGVDKESLEQYEGMMKGFLANFDEPTTEAWIKNQIYLALGSFLTACAIEGVDACPMEGFIPGEYDRILGLADKGLKSVVVCPIGYRSENDKYPALAKVRYLKSDVIG